MWFCVFGFEATCLGTLALQRYELAGLTWGGAALRRLPHHVQQDVHFQSQEVVLFLQLLVPPPQALRLPPVHAPTNPCLWSKDRTIVTRGFLLQSYCTKWQEISSPAIHRPFSNFRLCPAKFIVGVP